MEEFPLCRNNTWKGDACGGIAGYSYYPFQMELGRFEFDVLFRFGRSWMVGTRFWLGSMSDSWPIRTCRRMQHVWRDRNFSFFEWSLYQQLLYRHTHIAQFNLTPAMRRENARAWNTYLPDTCSWSQHYAKKRYRQDIADRHLSGICRPFTDLPVTAESVWHFHSAITLSPIFLDK